MDIRPVTRTTSGRIVYAGKRISARGPPARYLFSRMSAAADKSLMSCSAHNARLDGDSRVFGKIVDCYAAAEDLAACPAMWAQPTFLLGGRNAQSHEYRRPVRNSTYLRPSKRGAYFSLEPYQLVARPKVLLERTLCNDPRVTLSRRPRLDLPPTLI